MSNYLRMISYVRPHAKTLFAASGCMFLTTIFKSSPIAMLIPVIDRIIADKPIIVPNPQEIPVFIMDFIYKINTMPRLWILNAIIIIAVGFTLMKAIFQYGQTYLMSDTSHRVIRDMREKLYNKLIHLPLSFYSRHRAGGLVSRITYDTGIVRDAISEGLMDAILQPMTLAVNIIILLTIRWIFGIPWSFVLIITVVMPLIIYPVVRIGRLLKKFSHKSQDAMADINATLYESMSGIRVVQAFGMEGYEEGRFKKFNWGYYTAMMRHIGRNLLIHPSAEFVIVICGCVIIWIGASRVVDNQMSAGAFIAFSTALFSLFRPFKRLSRLHGINQTALAAAERIFSILDEEPDVQEAESPMYLPKIQDSIEYRRVTFAYDGGKPVLREVNLKVQAGEVVAIVGASGAGKTTLVNLLPRFYDPIQGEIYVDGTPIRKVALKSLRNQIGIVTQETILFNDSVSANIAYGKTDLDQEAIEKAANVANAHDFIKKLPHGYQTIVGDRGFKLSGGEKQRVAIARAVLKNPPILILDEATSALDSESERLVQEAIQSLMHGRTVLVIAHRLSTVKNASRILVLKEGEIIEEGKHDDLLKQGGLYQRLHEIQFSG